VTEETEAIEAPLKLGECVRLRQPGNDADVVYCIEAIFPSGILGIRPANTDHHYLYIRASSLTRKWIKVGDLVNIRSDAHMAFPLQLRGVALRVGRIDDPPLDRFPVQVRRIDELGLGDWASFKNLAPAPMSQTNDDALLSAFRVGQWVKRVDHAGALMSGDPHSGWRIVDISSDRLMGGDPILIADAEGRHERVHPLQIIGWREARAERNLPEPEPEPRRAGSSERQQAMAEADRLAEQFKVGDLVRLTEPEVDPTDVVWTICSIDRPAVDQVPVLIFSEAAHRRHWAHPASLIKLAPEPALEPKPEPAPEPKLEPKLEPEPEPKLEPKLWNREEPEPKLWNRGEVVAGLLRIEVAPVPVLKIDRNALIGTEERPPFGQTMQDAFGWTVAHDLAGIIGSTVTQISPLDGSVEVVDDLAVKNAVLDVEMRTIAAILHGHRVALNGSGNPVLLLAAAVLGEFLGLVVETMPSGANGNHRYRWFETLDWLETILEDGDPHATADQAASRED